MNEGERAWEQVRNTMAPINDLLFAKFGNRVLTGPFKGMQITSKPAWNDGNIGAKLIGSYEFELHEVIEKAISRCPSIVVNIGCAEGYYAIGLGMRLKTSEIYACDIDVKSVDQCRRIARDNKVDLSVKVGRHFNDIEGLWLVDCEGSEVELLDTEKYPKLLHSDIIVECHNFMNSRISSILETRFSSTHHVKKIVPEIPDPRHYPFLDVFPFGTKLLMMTDKRPEETAWLACWAN